MKNKNADLIQTWMLEAGTDRPSKNLKYQILEKIENKSVGYRPVIPPLFWKITGIGLLGTFLYFLLTPSKAISPSSWLMKYSHFFKIDFNFILINNTSPLWAYALLIFSIYVYLFPIVIRWWNNRLAS